MYAASFSVRTAHLAKVMASQSAQSRLSEDFLLAMNPAVWLLLSASATYMHRLHPVSFSAMTTYVTQNKRCCPGPVTAQGSLVVMNSQHSTGPYLPTPTLVVTTRANGTHALNALKAESKSR